MTTQHGEPQAPSPGRGAAQPPAGPLTAATRDLLGGLDDTPLREHVRVYDELHDRLAGALADPAAPPPSDAAPGPRAAAPASPGSSRPATRPVPGRRGG